MPEATATNRRPIAPRPVRPRELEDSLNHWLYHPLAWQLAKLLARTPLTPNQVSVAGGLTVVCAGISYVSPMWGGGAYFTACVRSTKRFNRDGARDLATAVTTHSVGDCEQREMIIDEV